LMMHITLQALAAITIDFCRRRVDRISPTTAYSTGPVKVEWIEKRQLAMLLCPDPHFRSFEEPEI